MAYGRPGCSYSRTWHLCLIVTAVIALAAGCARGEPVATPAPPTTTAALPAAAALPPAATSVPPAATSAPPTATATPIPPTPTPTPRAYPLVSPPASAALGDTWTRPTDGAAMVYVPAGEFKMGSDDQEFAYAIQLCKQYSTDPATARATCSRNAFSDERLAHHVALNGFWLDRTEVTNGQYRRCVEAEACIPPVDFGSYTRDSYYGDGAFDLYPVVWVTRDQAAGYCAWAGARLPTEAEWEYAARGPEGRVFPWGDTFDGTRLNYCDVNCLAGPNDPTVDDGYADTAPVASFPSGASWCGALDLAGNVREWVADWYGNYPGGRQVNPTGPSSGESRIPRGGSWLDVPGDIRSANRGGNSTDYTRHKVGFRCAASLPVGPAGP